VVDFLVLEQDDRPVSGLTAADLELTENGQQRKFTDFRAVGPTAENSEPRRFVITVNRRGAEAGRLRRARAALRRFASERLSADDEAMLVEIGATAEILQQFTPGGDALCKSLDDLGVVPYEVFEEPLHADGGGIWDLLGSVGLALSRVPGRKVVILLSVDQSTYPSSSPASWAWTFDQQAFLNAQSVFNAARAVVYFVDLAGDARNRFDPSFGAPRQDDPFAAFDFYSVRGCDPKPINSKEDLGLWQRRPVAPTTGTLSDSVGFWPGSTGRTSFGISSVGPPPIPAEKTVTPGPWRSGSGGGMTSR